MDSNQIQEQSSVTMKFKNNRLIFIFNGETEFKSLLKEFATKIIEVKTLLDGFKGSLELRGRLFTEGEKNRILNVIKRNTSLVLEYLYCNQGECSDDKGKNEFSMEEGVTKFHRGTLRSGSKIVSDGHLVILGDLNPGAIAEARGNVIILGKISGTVHAGYQGDRKAIIAGLSFNPVQLRIADLMAKNPNQGVLANKKLDRSSGMEIAYVKSEIITIDYYDKNLNF